MDKGYDIEAMLERQREIAAEMERLANEKEELDVAVRVLQRYVISETSTEPKLGPPRPEGTPTLFEMTKFVVRNAQLSGKDGLNAKEIVEEIRRAYWPGVKPVQILPQIYQFAKKGRMRKTSDGLFQNPETPGDVSRSDSDTNSGL
jgi:hypothetical protein